MSDVGYDPQIAPRELLEMLLDTHAQTLETLRLDLRFAYDLSDAELIEEIRENGSDAEYTYPSLHGFEKLKVLSIEFEKLPQVAILPPSLQKLELVHTRFRELGEVRLDALVRLRRTWCPAIQGVDVHGRSASYDGMKEVLGHARRLNVAVEADREEYPSVLTFLGEADFLVIRCLEPEEGCGNSALEIGFPVGWEEDESFT